MTCLPTVEQDCVPTGPAADAESGWTRWRHRLTWITGIVADVLAALGTIGLIVLFTMVILRTRSRLVPEVDSEGYFVMGRSFAQGQWPRWEDDYARFHSYVWVKTGENQVMAKYPPGWPLLMAVGYRVAGLDGALWVNVVASVVGAAAFGLLAWRLFNATAAMLCAALWLFSPMTIYYGAYQLTHTSDVACVLLAFLMVCLWARSGRWWLGIAAGFFVGFIPLIRPTSVLFWPALIVCYFVMRRRDGTRWRWGRDLLGFSLGVLPPLLFLAAFDWISFGAVWRTGYSLSHEQTAFEYSDWVRRLQSIESQKFGLLLPAAWAVGVLGLVVRSKQRGLSWMLLVWVLPTVVLYLGYYFLPDARGIAYLRFLLSALPACVLAAGFAFTTPFTRHPVVRLALTLLCAGWLYSSLPEWIGTIPRTDDAPFPRRSMVRPTFTWTTLAAQLRSERREPPAVRLSTGDHATTYAVYSNGRSLFTAASEYDVIAYDLDAWNTGQHYLQPMTDECAAAVVWEDPIRHRLQHEAYARIGRNGLRQDFIDHVRRDIEQGRQVVLIRDNEPGHWGSANVDRLMVWLRQGIPGTIEQKGNVYRFHPAAPTPKPVVTTRPVAATRPVATTRP